MEKSAYLKMAMQRRGLEIHPFQTVRAKLYVVNNGDIETPFIHFLICFSLLGLYSIFVGVVWWLNVSDGHSFEF